jgi:hypothetical protein
MRNLFIALIVFVSSTNSNAQIPREIDCIPGSMGCALRLILDTNERNQNIKYYINSKSKIINSDGTVTIETIADHTPRVAEGRSRTNIYKFHCSDFPEKSFSRVNFAWYGNILKSGGLISSGDINMEKTKVNDGSIVDYYFSAACNTCPPIRNTQHNSLEAAMNASRTKPASCVIGDSVLQGQLSINFNSGARKQEVMLIEGDSLQTGKVNMRIFSNGEAAIASNGGAKSYVYNGSGLFVGGNDKVIINEDNKSMTVNGNLIGNLLITKKDLPIETNVAYGKSRNFPRVFESAEDRTELMAACVSATSEFIKAARNTAFKTSDAILWSSCTRADMRGNQNFVTHLNKWNATFLSRNEPAAILNILFERCASEFVVAISSDGTCMR